MWRDPFFFSASKRNTNPSAFDMCDREHESEKSENGCVCFSSAGGPDRLPECHLNSVGLNTISHPLRILKCGTIILFAKRMDL